MLRNIVGAILYLYYVARHKELVIKPLFQYYVPLSLVNSWVKYTNKWVNSLLERGIVDSWNHDKRTVTAPGLETDLCCRDIYLAWDYDLHRNP